MTKKSGGKKGSQSAKPMNNPISVRLLNWSNDDLTTIAKSLGIRPGEFSRIAVESLLEAVKDNNGKLVLPVKFVPLHVGRRRILKRSPRKTNE